MARKPVKKSNVVSVNFEGVESRGRFHEDGEYHLKVNAATLEKGNKGDYISWEIGCVEGDSEGAIVYNNTSLSVQSLWNLKAMLEAIGIEVPDDELDIDLEEVVDLEFMGTVELETEGDYKGKPRLVDFWKMPEGEKPKRGANKAAAKEEPEEEPARRGAKGKAASKKEEATLTEDDIGDMSQDELQDVIDENKLDVDLKGLKTLRKMQAAVIDAAQEADLLTEGDATVEEPEEKEEEEKPARRSRRRSTR